MGSHPLRLPPVYGTNGLGQSMRRLVVLAVLLTSPIFFLAAQQAQAPTPAGATTNAASETNPQQSPDQQKAPKPAGPGAETNTRAGATSTGSEKNSSGAGQKDFSQEAFVIEKVVTH